MKKSDQNYSEIKRVARERAALGLNPPPPADRHSSPAPNDKVTTTSPFANRPGVVGDGRAPDATGPKPTEGPKPTAPSGDNK